MAQADSEPSGNHTQCLDGAYRQRSPLWRTSWGVSGCAENKRPMYNQQSDQDFLKTVPHSLIPWLEEAGSLTDRLHLLTQDAQLYVIHQGWAHSGWWEKYVLLIANSPCWHREILMVSRGHCCWYAKTIVEESVFLRHRDFFETQQQIVDNTSFWNTTADYQQDNFWR